MLEFAAKQTAGAVDQRPHLGPRDYLTVSIVVPKKSPHGEGGGVALSAGAGAKGRPRPGHSGWCSLSVLQVGD